MRDGFEPIYRDLLLKFMQAVRSNDKKRGDELFDLIEALRREYPDLDETHDRRVVMARGGWWDSCSGCTEGEDGYVNPKHYPPHPKHGVPTGSGCDECKGKGVVFHRFTKADAEAWEREFAEGEEEADREAFLAQLP